jgi:hypothetical protein
MNNATSRGTGGGGGGRRTIYLNPGLSRNLQHLDPAFQRRFRLWSKGRGILSTYRLGRNHRERDHSMLGAVRVARGSNTDPCGHDHVNVRLSIEANTTGAGWGQHRKGTCPQTFTRDARYITYLMMISQQLLMPLMACCRLTTHFRRQSLV